MNGHRSNFYAWIAVIVFIALAGGLAAAQEQAGQRLDETVTRMTIDATLDAGHMQQELVDGRMPTDAESIGAYLREGRWSPYVVGIGLGLLSWLTFLLCNHPLGASTAFSKSCGMLEKMVIGKKVENKEYYQKYTPVIDWEWMLVIGIVFGAFLSASLSGSLTFDWTPALWKAAFGDTPVLRVSVAILGGIFLGFGSRWADGCTSGHGLSGTMQLVLSSWIASICFFIGGVATAMVMYYVLA